MTISKKCRLFALAAIVGLVTIPAFASAQTDREPTGLQLASGLSTLVRGESEVIRVVETNRRADPSEIGIWVLDDRDRVVAKKLTVFGPGRPATLVVPFDRLGREGDFAALRVVIRLVLDELSAPVTTSEAVNGVGLVARVKYPCTPGQGSVGGSAQIDCPGWTVSTFFTD